MYTSTKRGKWEDPGQVLGYLSASYQTLRAHASVSAELVRRHRKMREEEGGGAVRDASVHVRHLRNLQPMDERVAEGVQGFGDQLEWAEREIRRMVIEKDESTADAAKCLTRAVEILDEWVDGDSGEFEPDDALVLAKRALKTLRENPNVDASLELDGMHGNDSEEGE